MAGTPPPHPLGRSAIEPARRDIFADGASAPVAAPDNRTAAVPGRDAAQESLQPPATLQAVHIQFAGSITTVEGEKKLFLVDGSQHVIAEPGVKLAGGHEVQTVSPALIRLHEPQSGTVVDLPIPQSPQTP